MSFVTETDFKEVITDIVQTIKIQTEALTMLRLKVERLETVISQQQAKAVAKEES